MTRPSLSSARRFASLALALALTLTLTLALALSLSPSETLAHPLCRDSTTPVTVTNPTYARCTAYSTTGSRDVCVTPAQESAQVPTLADTGDATCNARLELASCAAVDAWSAHLFRTEGVESELNKTMPWLCPTFCEATYADCAAAFDAAPGGIPTQWAPAAGAFTDAYPNATAFCSAFGTNPDTDVYCYSGTPFTLPAPAPFPTSLDLCVERIMGAPDGSAATIATIPGRPHLLAVASLAGQVRIWREDPATERWTSVKILINHAAELIAGGERGLLGVAFHKKFLTNGRFFLSYSCKKSGGLNCNDGDSIIDEFKVVNPAETSGAFTLANVASTRRRIFKLSQPYSNHNGGQILFSPDPKEPNLFFMLGDGGSGGDPDDRAQPLSKYWGKILRMDVDSTYPTPGFAVPSDNPFVNVPGALGAIWVNGVRNPWRCSFDSVSYDFYCGDVGQNRFEEVDLIQRGRNYGWSRFEGYSLYNADRVMRGNLTHTPPLLTYSHASMGGSASVIGGHVYRSRRDPRLFGWYVFGDLYQRFFVAQPRTDNGGKTFNLTRVAVKCSGLASRPLTCPQGGYQVVLTFGETLARDVLFGNYQGVYRFVELDACAPTPQPSRSPTALPTRRPTKQPTAKPTRRPTTPRPTQKPTTRRPTKQPTAKPTRAG